MKKSIGIDLGTTNSVVAFKDTSVRIYRNKEGEEQTRSCVGLVNNELLVGSRAYLGIKRDPENTILSIKRLMGGAIKDDGVQRMIESPYYKFGITRLQGGTDDAVAVILGGKQYTPEQLSAEILKKLKEDAEERLGDAVSHAVITVPAYFTEKQKNATRRAAQLAGLKVQKLLAEPTAAAIAYGVDNIKTGESRTVMVYDFGGGTFDLSVLNIVDGQFMEAGTGGDRWLGGDDLDKELQELVLKKVADEYHISNINSVLANLSQKHRNNFEGAMKIQCENAKIQLSSAQTANIYIDNLLEDDNGETIDVDVTVSRDEFENLAEPFISRSIELIENLLNEIGYDASMIDDILLVGGTSCIPLVKEKLSEKMGKEKVRVAEKPMLSVAEGAAILSNKMGDEYEPPLEGEEDIADISYSTNHNYFLELQEQSFDKIIEKQTPLPCNVTRIYKTTIENQKVVKVGVHADVEGGNKELQTLGFFTLDEDLPQGSNVVIDFSLSIDEIFKVTAYSQNNKSRSKEVVLSRGNKDGKTLELLSSSLEKVLTKNYNNSQKQSFFNSAQKEIERINTMGANNYDSPQWEEIGESIFNAFEKAENIKDTVDEYKLAGIYAKILIYEYPHLIGGDVTERLKNLLSQSEYDEDPLRVTQAKEKLKEITDQYITLIALYTIKLASDNAAKENPADGHKLLQMHDEIVRLFRERRKDEAFELLDKAIELRDKYGLSEKGLSGSIYLQNS